MFTFCRYIYLLLFVFLTKIFTYFSFGIVDVTKPPLHSIANKTNRIVIDLSIRRNLHSVRALWVLSTGPIRQEHPCEAVT